MATRSKGMGARSRRDGGVRERLSEYRRKRDFSRTAEPSGSSQTGTATRRRAKRAAGATHRRGPRRVQRTNRTGPLFVIQKHAASSLHYDFRLEIDGVLKSWAVPKGPSIDPSVKRLAVEVEDHPMEYAGFEGIIPEGQYGGGTVIVWDTGTYHNLKDDHVTMREAWEMGRIEVWLEGDKLRGGWNLIRTGMGDRRKNWLLFKQKDEHAKSLGEDAEGEPTASQAKSAVSGRTVERVAQAKDRVWR